MTVALLLATTACADATRETVAAHTVYFYVPKALPADKPAPLLLLFHGSRRDGMTQINEWWKLADKEGIVLAAPNATDAEHWSIPEDGPDLLRELVKAAEKRHRIDPRRIYAFGHSAGGGFMLNMAPLESGYLAAVAVHAGQFRNVASSGTLPFAERKIPIFIVIGTRDQLLSVESVRQTREGFAGAGFPIETREIEGHDHNYYRVSGEINDMAWTFLSPKHLDADPHFREYKINRNSEKVSIEAVAP
jgi:dienelactone hydrolase